MTLNSHALPANWIKEGMIVRCTAPQAVGLMQVRVVHSNGGISARRPRMTKDSVVMLNADCFEPATIEDRVLFTLDAANIGEIRKINPDGKDDRQFRIIFMSDRPGTAVIDSIKKLVEKVESPERLGNAIVVTVPQSWLDELVIADPVTPAVAARAQAETDLILEQAAASAPNQRPQRTIADVGIDRAVYDWFVRDFTRLGVDMTDVQIAPAARLGRAVGQDPTYTLIWPSTQAFGANIKLVSAAARELRLQEFFANDRYIKVDLPAEWTPTYGEPVQVTVSPEAAERLVSEHGLVYNEEGQLDAPTVDDADLSETARLIADLRERNERLQITNENLREQVDSLIGYIDGGDLRAQDAEELEPAQSLTTCKEVKTLRGISDADLQTHINGGWDILHYQFTEDVKLHVVLQRDMPAPVAPTPARTAARMVTPVGPHIIVEPTSNGGVLSPNPVLNQRQTSPVNFGTDITTARADLRSKLDDPAITHEDFYRMVITSRLPRQERDELINQSRQIRVGGKITAQTAMFVASPFANQPPIRIGAAALVEVNQ